MNTEQLNQAHQLAFKALIYNITRFSERAGIREGDARKALCSFAPGFLGRSTDDEQNSILLADRLAAGFTATEAPNHNSNIPDARSFGGSGQTWQNERLLSLFEQVRLNSQNDQKYSYCLPLEPLSPSSIFTKKRTDCLPKDNTSAVKAYKNLWDAFIEALEKIPVSHKRFWPLWLDHFDTAWQTFTHAIPTDTNGNRPEVSLYDHSHTAAALTVAHYYWKTSPDKNEKPFLIVQGDFFGIQDFIFADGRQTNKQAAKLLRGRSFQVSMMMELAALRIMDSLNLPTTSQVINAAGKFQIIAPNTNSVIEKLKELVQEFNNWFLKNTYGIAGIGLAWEEAVETDFIQEGDNFKNLMKRLFQSLEKSKLKRYNLCSDDTPIKLMADIAGEDFVPCAWQGRMPADKDKDKSNKASCPLSRDQIEMGKRLVNNRTHLLLVTLLPKDDPINRRHFYPCEMSIFNSDSFDGYRVVFANRKAGKELNRLLDSEKLVRCWDFSLPEDATSPLWNGYARRNINSYVPYFSSKAEMQDERYNPVRDEESVQEAEDENLLENADVSASFKYLGMKTFNHLACEDREKPEDTSDYRGQVALCVLKGDVDNLGNIFQRGISNPSFAKTAALSRQLNAFFAIWLPTYCATNYPNTYTIFAGGDDFFMIGPWYSTQKLAGNMAKAFAKYTANNPEVHFSAGMVMTKPGYPVYTLAEKVEEELGEAKNYKVKENPTGNKAIDEKNAVRIFEQTVSWHNDWDALSKVEENITATSEACKLSEGYLYSLFSLTETAVKSETKIEANIWHSHFRYQTIRALDASRKKDKFSDVLKVFYTEGINRYKGAFNIPLSNYFYRKR